MIHSQDRHRYSREQALQNFGKFVNRLDWFLKFYKILQFRKILEIEGTRAAQRTAEACWRRRRGADQCILHVPLSQNCFFTVLQKIDNISQFSCDLCWNLTPQKIGSKSEKNVFVSDSAEKMSEFHILLSIHKILPNSRQIPENLWCSVQVDQILGSK